MTQASDHSELKPLWVTPQQAMRLISIKRTMLYELINDGTLKTIKLGRKKRLISYASIEALKDR